MHPHLPLLAAMCLGKCLQENFWSLFIPVHKTHLFFIMVFLYENCCIIPESHQPNIPVPNWAIETYQLQLFHVYSGELDAWLPSTVDSCTHTQQICTGSKGYTWRLKWRENPLVKSEHALQPKQKQKSLQRTCNCERLRKRHLQCCTMLHDVAGCCTWWCVSGRRAFLLLFGLTQVKMQQVKKLFLIRSFLSFWHSNSPSEQTAQRQIVRPRPPIMVRQAAMAAVAWDPSCWVDLVFWNWFILFF